MKKAIWGVILGVFCVLMFLGLSLKNSGETEEYEYVKTGTHSLLPYSIEKYLLPESEQYESQSERYFALSSSSQEHKSEEYESDYSSDSEEYEENEEDESDYSTDTSYTSTSVDHNCSDFATQKDAQLFYVANGGPYSDPHDLDRDNDGNACDWNP